jgi:methylenetetrahydrofolate reductase (NADPH)
MMADSPRGQPPALMSGWSLEATRPRAAEIDALAHRLAPGTEIFLSTLPHVSLDEQIETAQRMRAAGLEPVLHVAARYFASRTELVGYLTRATREAQAGRVLAIAGDLDRPRGPFNSALSLIESGVFADFGIASVGIAGYPEGHPKIGDDRLVAALDAKLAALARAGLAARIVTQFGFSAAPIVGWTDAVRTRWPDVPVRIGLAGPARASTLLKFAVRCGVAASIGGIGRNLMAAGQLMRTVSPQPVVAEMSATLPHGDAGIAIHLFSFGGLVQTVDWVGATWPACLPAAGGSATAGR